MKTNERETKMNQAKKRILLIDDDETVLEVISGLLRSLGCDVKSTSEALDAIDLLEQKTFDLVITDMIMPQVGGLALTKVIRQEQPQLPIVAISGHYEKLIHTVHKPDVDAILPKPVTLETLRRTLNAVFPKRGN
jgi:CheY-like chemotaxis protein